MKQYAGLDWASAEHAVRVIDERGAVVERLKVEHTAEGLAGLVRALRRLGDGVGEAIAVAIERPSGLVVDTLVEAGQPLVPIHPNVVKASRPRDDFVATWVQFGNQLRSLLGEFWPGGAEIFAPVDSPIALDFLERFPAPRDAAKLDEKRLGRFLATHSYCGRRTAAELLERLHAAPKGLAGEVEEESRRAQVLALVAVLRPLVAQIAKLSAAIEHDVAQLAVGRVVMSFPRAGHVNAAQIVAELGDDRSRFVDADHLAAEAGVAPVTRSSGKHKAVACRFACNKRLRQALTCWADNSRHASEWAAGLYRRARARRCDHPHAVRVVARAWCRVLWRCWHDGVTYDPERHAGAVAIRPPSAMPAA